MTSFIDDLLSLSNLQLMQFPKQHFLVEEEDLVAPTRAQGDVDKNKCKKDKKGRKKG